MRKGGKIIRRCRKRSPKSPQNGPQILKAALESDFSSERVSGAGTRFYAGLTTIEEVDDRKLQDGIDQSTHNFIPSHSPSFLGGEDADLCWGPY